MFGKIFCGFIGGLMVTIFSAWVFGPVVVLIPGFANSGAGLLFWGIWLLMMVLSVRASRTGSAWRKVLLISAALCFLMPFSAILLTGTLASHTSSGIQLGSIIGMGGSMFVASLLMVVFGIVFLITGLLVGRNKKVRLEKSETTIETV